FTTTNFVDTTASSRLKFAASTTYTVSGSLNLNGQAVGTRIVINSSDGATRFTFATTGSTQPVSYVDVSNSQVSNNNVTAANSINRLNTDADEAAPHWVFTDGGCLSDGTAGGCYDTNWSHRKLITINCSMTPNTDQTDFPVLIYRNTDTEFSVAAQADADDFVFTDSDGTTILDFEVESYLTASGSLAAWVRIPTLSQNTDTNIYVYYGNGTSGSLEDAPGTFSNNFGGVWHLGETP